MICSNTIIVVARNNLALTKKTVASALAQDVPCQVLVVDNASSDGTAEWLRSKERIHYWSERKQQSLARCWNVALKCTWATGGEHALVLNNDVEINPCAYRLLAGQAEHQGREFVTAVSVEVATQFREPALDWSYHVRPHPDFSCFMITKTCFDKVGPFWEELHPAWFEDNDYHVRMTRAGVNAVCVDIPFLHHGASTMKYASPSEQAELRRGYDRNKKQFFKRYGFYPGTPEYERATSVADPKDSREAACK